MARSWVVFCAALLGCGRTRFDPVTDGADGFVGCTHTFCDDFDRPAPVETGWTSATVTGGLLSLDSTTSVSSPSSLRVDLTSTATGSALLEQTFAPTAITSVHYAFDLAIETADSTAELDLAQMKWLTVQAPCTGLGFYIVRTRAFSPPKLVMQETYSGCGGNTDDILPFTTGFHHIDVLVLTGAANVAHLTVTVDDALAVDRPVPVPVPASRVQLDLGAPAIQAVNASWVIHYDNVAVDLQ